MAGSYPWDPLEQLDNDALNAAFATAYAGIAAANAAITSLTGVVTTLVATVTTLTNEVVALQTQPWTGVIQSSGIYTNAQEIANFQPALAVTFAAAYAGSFVSCETAPTGSVSGSILYNGSAAGTWSIASGQTAGTFALAAGYTTAASGFLKVLAPASADATLAGLRFSMFGHRPAP